MTKNENEIKTVYYHDYEKQIEIYKDQIEKYIINKCNLDRDNVKEYTLCLYTNKVLQYYDVTAHLFEEEGLMFDKEFYYRIQLEDVMENVVVPEHRHAQLKKIIINND